MPAPHCLALVLLLASPITLSGMSPVHAVEYTTAAEQERRGDTPTLVVAATINSVVAVATAIHKS